LKAATLWDSFRFALQGLGYSFKTQRNFRIHCCAAVVLAAIMLLGGFETWQMLFLFSAVFSVLTTELINTAVEKTIDLYTSSFHPLAKIAKNCAAAAVLLAALYAVIVGVVIFLPKVWEIGR